ncbi:GerAB/ArcD/ProY family transporter [Paenibacillus sp. GCM10023248]|uniref:GerAB/ArcD/ProY family transporter n=1 Tax=Bacillales TaxID=1385 RepID=UPI002378057A|nr:MULTISPECIES: GerAB/ArcD/ProY family transporter [Bacillales]MDD9266447.1 GerAB/ArcD/ProY family transporter [Paenibacillus sp. MAHUQ-63]MDR6878572.1 spore germination protein KB [Bacillus sp. 3255]
MERISNYQIGVMIILFQIGSTPLFAIGSKAKQDSWIAMLCAAVFGLLLLRLFLYIQSIAPDQSLIVLLRMCFGKIAGGILSICFTIYFAYESMRNVRDFGEITSVTLLAQTPKFVVMLLVMLLATYMIIMGIETFCRVVESLILPVLISYGVLSLLIFGSRLMSLEHIQPVMEKGLTPILKAAFPDLVSFPFGQMVVFLMFWHLMADKKKINRISTISYLGVALFLIGMNIINLLVLGPSLIGNSTLPFLQTVQLIQVGDIFERLDVFVTLLLFLGLFVKLAAFYWAAAYGVSQLMRGNSKYSVCFVGIVIFISSFFEPSYTFHVWLGLAVSVKLFPIFQVALPFAMFIAILLRKLKKRPSPDESKELPAT